MYLHIYRVSYLDSKKSCTWGWKISCFLCDHALWHGVFSRKQEYWWIIGVHHRSICCSRYVPIWGLHGRRLPWNIGLKRKKCQKLQLIFIYLTIVIFLFILNSIKSNLKQKYYRSQITFILVTSNTNVWHVFLFDFLSKFWY